jgi:hypothetical protein
MDVGEVTLYTVYMMINNTQITSNSQDAVILNSNGMKTCTCCEQEKTLPEFKKDRYSKDGRATYCKDCSNAQHAEYRSGLTQEGIDKAKAYKQQYDKDNKDKINAYRRDYRAKLKLEAVGTKDEAADYQQAQDEYAIKMQAQGLPTIADDIDDEPKLTKAEKAKEKQDLADKTAKLIADFKMGSKP